MREIVIFIFKVILFPVPRSKFKIIKKILSRVSGIIDIIYCSHSTYANIKIQDILFKVYIEKNNSQAHNVYKDLFEEKKTYEVQQIICLKNIYEITKKPIFADIGSFIGYFAFYASSLDNGRNTIYAIESNKNHCDSIQKGIHKNNFKNIKILNKILSNEQKNILVVDELTIDPKKFDELKSFRSEDPLLDDLKLIDKKKKYYLENSERLDDVFKNEIPNILKIDVHGAEGFVLDGAEKLLKEHIDYILLELHSESYLKRYSTGFNKKKIILNLISKNFSCYFIAANDAINLKKTNHEETSSFLKDRGKLNYLSINEKNIDNFLFNRDNEEEFILCIKKNISIQNLKCF